MKGGQETDKVHASQSAVMDSSHRKFPMTKLHEYVTINECEKRVCLIYLEPRRSISLLRTRDRISQHKGPRDMLNFELNAAVSHRWPPRHLHRGQTSGKPLNGGVWSSMGCCPLTTYFSYSTEHWYRNPSTSDQAMLDRRREQWLSSEDIGPSSMVMSHRLAYIWKCDLELTARETALGGW